MPLQLTQSAFTLIELLITAALIAFLLFATVPLTTNWINQGHAEEGKNILSLAFTKAQSFALKNADLHSAKDGAISSICLFKNQLQVRSAGGNRDNINLGQAHCDAVPGNTQLLYQSNLPSGLIFTENNEKSTAINTQINCICFSRNGRITDSDTCNPCVTSNSLKLTVTKGDSHEEVMLY